MYPRTKYQSEALSKHDQAFYIIDTPPPNGCVIGNSTWCTGSEMLHPVSSESTGLVYSNENCALCHGAVDFELWKPALNCELRRGTDIIDIFSELISFVKNPETSVCYLGFAFNGDDDSKIKYQTCNIYSSVSQALDYYPINAIDWFNISDEVIVDLCFSDFNLPFYFPVERLWFQNPFCFLYAMGPPMSTCNEFFRFGQDTPTFSALLKVDTISQAVSQDKGLCRSCNQEVCERDKKPVGISCFIFSSTGLSPAVFVSWLGLSVCLSLCPSVRPLVLILFTQ